MNTLFIIGAPDDGQATITISPDGKTGLNLSGTTNIGPFFEKITENTQRICLSGQSGPQQLNIDFEPDIIVNEISDPDSHTVALARAKNLCKLKQAPIFNKPEAILKTRRDHIYQRLSNLNHLIVPKTIYLSPRSPQDIKNEIANNNLNFPIIFRQAGDHGGVSTSIINNVSEIEAIMYKYALDGRSYYITEFIDYASKNDKLYRKFRLVVIDGAVHLRHLIVSDHWLIHASSRNFMNDNPLYKTEEKNTLESFDNEIRPKITPLIKKITDVLQLDYYGIDGNFDSNGNLLVFEINANMNILINPQRSPNIWDEPIIKIKQAIQNLILSKAKQ